MGLISYTGAYPLFLTKYWYPRLGHTPFLSASHWPLMFAYRPRLGHTPLFHLDLGVWFLAYSSHLLAFPRRYTGASPLPLWVVWSLSFQRLSSIVSGSVFVSTALRHRVRIPFHLADSPAFCSDPLSFQRLSSIVLESLFFFMALRHHAPIPLSFRQHSNIVPGSLFFFMALWHRA